MADKKIKGIIFDIGRVLVRVDISRALNGLTRGITMSPHEAWVAIEKDPRWPDWQEGRISPRDWHLHLGKRFGTDLTFEEFVETWNRALDPVAIHEDSFFAELAKNYRMTLLSNTDPIHAAFLEKTYSFYKYFPKRVYSFALGAAKPDPLIYREALRAVKCQAAEAIFIDDVPEFVDGARKLGITAIQYESKAQLQKALQDAGVRLS